MKFQATYERDAVVWLPLRTPFFLAALDSWAFNISPEDEIKVEEFERSLGGCRAASKLNLYFACGK